MLLLFGGYSYLTLFRQKYVKQYAINGHTCTILVCWYPYRQKSTAYIKAEVSTSKTRLLYIKGKNIPPIGSIFFILQFILSLQYLVCSGICDCFKDVQWREYVFIVHTFPASTIAKAF